MSSVITPPHPTDCGDIIETLEEIFETIGKCVHD